MRFVVNNAQMRSAEADCDLRFISYSQMMENAGRAIATRISEDCKPCTAAVLCGSGNNGGDGFVTALLLSDIGFKVRVILTNGEPKTDCARHFFEKLPKDIVMFLRDSEEKCSAFVQNAELVVDCVFGTGFHGTLPEQTARLFDCANMRPRRVAADVPSGINSDTGEFDSRCFKATKTCVLAAMKIGMTNAPCRDLLGNAYLEDIGIDDSCFKEFEAVLTDDSARSVLPKRLPSAHKGTFGRLINIAGSLSYCGAAAMSTRAALRGGAGLCTLAAPISVVKALIGAIPETVCLPLPETSDGFVGENAEEFVAQILPKMTAAVVGCGLGNSENTRKITEFVVKNADCPIIIDADGINSIADNINVLKERTGAAVLTPHPLEFSRICGKSVVEIQSDRIKSARNFAREFGVILVLKGAYTVVTDGCGTFVNTSGNAALAKGGSGDVLAGIIGAMLAQGVPPLTAAASGVYCHGFAADLVIKNAHPAAVLASDIIDALPRVFTD